jgi:hypothetical protein
LPDPSEKTKKKPTNSPTMGAAKPAAVGAAKLVVVGVAKIRGEIAITVSG